MLLDISPSPAVIQQVDKGYADGQACRRVLDPLDLTMCVNQVYAAHRTEVDADPAFGLGLVISLYEQNDDINQRLQGLRPSVQDALQVSDNVTLGAVFAVVKAGGRAKSAIPNYRNWFNVSRANLRADGPTGVPAPCRPAGEASRALSDAGGGGIDRCRMC